MKKQDNKTMMITLRNIAFVPSFHTGVISLQRFEAIGGAWNSHNKSLTCNGKLFCYVLDKFSQYVLEYNLVPSDTVISVSDSAFPT